MSTPSRRGFTLTELMVTTAIMATLMTFVVIGTRPSRNSNASIRQGAQQLASTLLASQSLSLGSPTGAAVIIDSSGAAADIVSHARRYPFIEGIVAAGMPVIDPAITLAEVALQPQNDSADSVQHGYSIRFLDHSATNQTPPSDWFSFAFNSVVEPKQNQVLAKGFVTHRAENGLSTRTTLWPSATVSGTLSFQIARYPLPTGLIESLPRNVAIDLRYSGLANPTNPNWGSLAGRGAIAIGFDSVGAMDTIMQNVMPTGVKRTIQPMTPQEDVYLFVTSRKDIDDPLVNPLSNASACWVVVHPKTGRVTISPNVPQSGNDANAIVAAREHAIEGRTFGG